MPNERLRGAENRYEERDSKNMLTDRGGADFAVSTASLVLIFKVTGYDSSDQESD